VAIHREREMSPRPQVDRTTILGAAIDAAPVCVFVADAEMRYVAVNAYACELLGYSEEELLKMKVTDVASYAEAPEEYATMMSAAYLRGVSHLRCKDGEVLILNYVAGEVEFDGVSAFVSVGIAEFVSDD
jgi:two-component system sensor histidine kinase/response regulator